MPYPLAASYDDILYILAILFIVFSLNKSDLMVALCCVYTGCRMFHTAARAAAAALAHWGFKLLYAVRQNRSWDLSTVTVPFFTSKQSFSH